ncbi:MAG: hypothetical protein U9R38_05975 [Candidatus Margulisiibacteriota bacterium]|nr:hypothetical protein [Candidatus Margulisiibacteriota bacterium]
MKNKKQTNPNLDENGDFILRWKLDIPKKKRRSKDPFKDFVKDLLKETMDIVALTYKGEDVKVDGFHFLDSVKINKLYK